MTDGSGQAYLLQSINQQVFTKPDSTMAAMLASIRAQQEYLAQNPPAPGEEWEPITLLPTRDGEPYLRLRDRFGSSVWRLMVKIPGCCTYKSLSELPDHRRMRVAEEAARGLARYATYTASVDASRLASPLPGYRDTHLYYQQLSAVLQGCRTLQEAASYLPGDEELRQSTEQHFLVHLPVAEYRRRLADPEIEAAIDLAEGERKFGLTLLREMAAGRIRQVAIHGDTKLDNFLFDRDTHRVKAVVDLDTIMPHTWLADWGDMVRSLVNVAGEKERDLSQVTVDAEIYDALARGFLSAAETTPAEVALLVDAVEIIALELGVRFLTDYLRGDTYFKLGPADAPDLNRTRALVQLTLFRRLREHAPEARRRIQEILSTPG